MQINRSKRGIFIYHSPDGLIGQGFTGWTHKKIITVFDFYDKLLFIFFQNMNYIIIANLDTSLFRTFSKDKNDPII